MGKRWIATAVFAATLVSVSAQMGMGGMGGKKKTFSPVKSDAKYIGCDVCERMVSEAVAQAADLRAEAPKQKLEEEQVHAHLSHQASARRRTYLCLNGVGVCVWLLDRCTTCWKISASRRQRRAGGSAN